MMGKTSGMFGVMGRRMIMHSCFVTGSGKMAMRCGVVGVDTQERVNVTKNLRNRIGAGKNLWIIFRLKTDPGNIFLAREKFSENIFSSKKIREIIFLSDREVSGK